MTVNIEGNTLLHLMMDAAMTDILEYVLQKGRTSLFSENLLGGYFLTFLTGVIDVNAKNADGLTALHLACKVLEPPNDYEPAEDLTPNVELLLKYKADVNALSSNNQTPLMFALAQENLEAARILVSAELICRLHELIN